MREHRPESRPPKRNQRCREQRRINPGGFRRLPAPESYSDTLEKRLVHKQGIQGAERPHPLGGDASNL